MADGCPSTSLGLRLRSALPPLRADSFLPTGIMLYPLSLRELMDLQAAVDVRNLRRVYRTTVGVFRRRVKEVVAVEDISFSVEPGELFGLLGPNGAGKTTTVKMLTTLLIPTGGTARVLGRDVVREADSIRGLIGFIFGGERGLYWRLSGQDNLRYFASLYHVAPEVSRKRIPYLLDLVGLADRGKEKGERSEE